MKLQKAQLSASDSERTQTATGYGILLQILGQAQEMQRNRKHGARLHRGRSFAEL